MNTKNLSNSSVNDKLDIWKNIIVKDLVYSLYLYSLDKSLRASEIYWAIDNDFSNCRGFINIRDVVYKKQKLLESPGKGEYLVTTTKSKLVFI